jgi:hypothetical protein
LINDIKYTKVDSLESLADEVNLKAKDSEGIHNLVVTCSISADNLKSNSLLDVTDDAKKWIDVECPDDLHINHGQYVKGGMEHIITELKSKPSSNRALYSLISQDHISLSGDKPIPSFLIFQTKWVGSELYASVYLRALETHRFLRINLEEIRLRLVQILESVNQIKSVNLCIHSFYAYCNTSIVPLIKPKIDLLNSPTMGKILRLEPQNMFKLLEEKSNNSTVVDLTAIQMIKDIIVADPPDRLDSDKEHILLMLDDCIKKGNILKTRRETTSHCEDLEKISTDFSSSLLELAKRLSNES